MQIQQLSIFVENKSGRLAEITEILGQAGVDIRAISVADTSDFGILRLIVDKPKEAVEALRAANLTVSLTSVIAVGIDDKPGEFAKAMRVLADGEIGGLVGMSRSAVQRHRTKTLNELRQRLEDNGGRNAK